MAAAAARRRTRPRSRWLAAAGAAAGRRSEEAVTRPSPSGGLPYAGAPASWVRASAAPNASAIAGSGLAKDELRQVEVVRRDVQHGDHLRPARGVGQPGQPGRLPAEVAVRRRPAALAEDRGGLLAHGKAPGRGRAPAIPTSNRESAPSRPRGIPELCQPQPAAQTWHSPVVCRRAGTVPACSSRSASVRAWRPSPSSCSSPSSRSPPGRRWRRRRSRWRRRSRPRTAPARP